MTRTMPAMVRGVQSVRMDTSSGTLSSVARCSLISEMPWGSCALASQPCTASLYPARTSAACESVSTTTPLAACCSGWGASSSELLPAGRARRLREPARLCWGSSVCSTSSASASSAKNAARASAASSSSSSSPSCVAADCPSCAACNCRFRTISVNVSSLGARAPVRSRSEMAAFHPVSRPSFCANGRTLK